MINYKSYEYDVGRKKVELWSINNLPKWIFPRYYISALTVCWSLKFLHALEIHQVPLAHTTNEEGSAPQILMVNI